VRSHHCVCVYCQFSPGNRRERLRSTAVASTGRCTGYRSSHSLDVYRGFPPRSTCGPSLCGVLVWPISGRIHRDHGAGPRGRVRAVVRLAAVSKKLAPSPGVRLLTHLRTLFGDSDEMATALTAVTAFSVDSQGSIHGPLRFPTHRNVRRAVASVGGLFSQRGCALRASRFSHQAANRSTM
jgi:hypothetical protein